MSTYVGTRIVPKHCGEWDSTVKYEVLSIVYDASTGCSYMARKAVPKGTELTDADYWSLCANFSSQLAAAYDDLMEEIQRSHPIAVYQYDTTVVFSLPLNALRLEEADTTVYVSNAAE